MNLPYTHHPESFNGSFPFLKELAINESVQNLSPIPRFLKIQEISETVLRKREVSQLSNTKKKELKMEQRKESLLRSLQIYAVDNPESGTTTSPKEFVLFFDPSWTNAIDADVILKGDLFAGVKRAVHITPMSPDEMEILPGQTTSDSIGPNRILHLESLQRISHCTPDLNANNDHRAWCGGLGFCMAYFFYFGHYSMHYRRGDGRTYYCYIVFWTRINSGMVPS